MVRISFLASALVLVTGLLFAQDLKYVEYDTDHMNPAVFKAHRDSVRREIGQEAIALLFSAPERPRNADVSYKYRQDDNFYYLTGFEEPNSILVLLPAGWNVPDPTDSTKQISVKEILFVQARNKQMEVWTGRRFGAEGAVKLKGAEYALTNDKFKSVLWDVVSQMHPQIIYSPNVPLDAGRQLGPLLKPLQAAIDSQKSWQKDVKDPGMIIRRLRIIKSPEEIAMIAKASEISALAHRQAMMSCEPGMHEYDVQAVYEYVYTKSGAEFTAYPCIVGSAENSVILHYESNRRQIKNGDIIVADCGAEYHNYASDVTRSYPANGKFSPAQKQIYQLVLDAQKAAIEMLKPGAAMADVSTRAAEVIEDGLLSLGIIKEKGKQEYRKYFNHGLGHAVGLDVHDAGGRTLEEGMVYTIEPGIYIPEGSEGVNPVYNNIGVRIEDTILITADGYKILSAGAPKEIKEVEALMAKKGIGNQPLR
ncbi:MAG: aminopeptidase P N-terminal domain-containing protein [Ignavibacteriales bacterium]|nr:aminopeptidase P N-terminal domain-containing protein [Ignavibacteriales bacterium]